MDCFNLFGPTGAVSGVMRGLDLNHHRCQYERDGFKFCQNGLRFLWVAAVSEMGRI